MKTNIKLFITLLALLLAFDNLSAQKNDSDSKAREGFIETQAKYLAHELALDGKTTAQLVEVYTRQQREIWALETPQSKRQGSGEAQSEQAIQGQFQRSQQTLAIRERYYKEFSKFMTQKQIERMYELERENAKQLSTRGKKVQDGNKQEIPFNGIVTDMLDQPIKGVTIWGKSEDRYSRSDKNGKFGLTNVMATDTLHLRYKKTRYNIPVQGMRGIRIRLGDQFEAKEDEALVNQGYGFVKRRERLVPSSGMSGEELAKTGKSNILEAINGRISGVQIVNGRVIIRGIGTNSDYTDPLFIVDGTIVSSLDYLDVNLVDHVEVLKDASIYGAQGANGAILVTTKRGK